MQDVTFERWPWWRSTLLAAILALIATIIAADLIGDLRAGGSTGHAIAEGSVIAIAVAGVAWLLAQLAATVRAQRAQAREAVALRESLSRLREDSERWRRDAARWTQGLGDAIDRQLHDWGLTAAEREVALLLLKGLSHKEIAAVRSVTEASVRQQATSLYRKAGLEGRNALAAFFLEDVLAPRSEKPGDER